MLKIFLTLSPSFFLFSVPSKASPAALQVEDRAVKCNSDNCYRQLFQSTAQASPYCSSYLHNPAIVTQTVTVTTTIPPFTDAPLSTLGKRDAMPEPAITAAPVPFEVEEQLEKRAASFSPTACTENPTAVSSGCSCLLASLSTLPATTTLTATATSTVPLPTQCNATTNYGRITDGFSLLDNPNTQYNHYYSFNESRKGACCSRCFATPSCLAFSEGYYADGNVLCDFWELAYSNPVGPGNSTQCPLGTITVSITQPDPTGYSGSGVGPCGVAKF